MAFVRLGEEITKSPELYFVPANKANGLINRKYPNHSLQMDRSKVLKKYRDHDFNLVEQLLNEADPIVQIR